MEISLIVPARNEQHRLVSTIERYRNAAYQRFGSDFEIIIVANGYSDNTPGVANKLADRFSQVSVLDIPIPIGKGGAILEGFRKATGNFVLFVDADGATSPETLFGLVDNLSTNDIVIGSRRLPDSIIVNPQPLTRQVFSNCFARSVKLLFRMPYLDTQCGAKAFSWNAARQLVELVEEKRWAFDVDLLLCARKLNLNVAEQAVTWEDQPGSQLRIGSTIVEILQSLWRLKFRHANLKLDLEPSYAREVI